MIWHKQGLLIRPDSRLSWMRSHASVPFAQFLKGDVYRVYFSSRDRENRSRIGYADVDLIRQNVLRVSQKPVLDLGLRGCFDDNGVTPSWIVPWGKKWALYYTGWNRGTTVSMHLAIGLALSADGGRTFVRHSHAPLLERTPQEPYLTASPCLLREGPRWHMWYVSGEGWQSPSEPIYNIKYAESGDGVHWQRSGRPCIPFSLRGEHAMARPSVLKDRDRYKVWFASRGPSYRLRYAESKNGLRWIRKDRHAGLPVSARGWDSRMVEYAHVIRHRGRLYMFYNGNDYGRDGIGLALGEP